MHIHNVISTLCITQSLTKVGYISLVKCIDFGPCLNVEYIYTRITYLAGTGPVLFISVLGDISF